MSWICPKVKKLKNIKNSYLKIIEKTSIYKISLEPFSSNLWKYIVMILCP